MKFKEKTKKDNIKLMNWLITIYMKIIYRKKLIFNCNKFKTT